MVLSQIARKDLNIPSEGLNAIRHLGIPDGRHLIFLQRFYEAWLLNDVRAIQVVSLQLLVVVIGPSPGQWFFVTLFDWGSLEFFMVISNELGVYFGIRGSEVLSNFISIHIPPVEGPAWLGWRDNGAITALHTLEVIMI